MTKSQFDFLPAYAPIFYSDKTYYLISGGRASGKSTQVAAYFLMKMFGDDFFRGVISRYTLRSISNSIYRDILDLIDLWGVKDHVSITGEEIRNKRNSNMIITHALKLTEGSMSAKSKGLANVTHLLIDEATELESEEEYIKLIDSFRTKAAERKIFLTFNPTAKNHWIYRRFYLPDGTPNPKWTGDHCYLHTTYHDNAHNLDPKKMEEWERLKDSDPDYYAHHILGQWRDINDGQVFTHWHWQYDPDPEAEVIYGVDFGFSRDPSAVIKVSKKGRRLWLQEVIYQTGLINEDLAKLMQQRGIPSHATIIADSAEPKSIETLRRLGFRNIRPAVKGPDSIRSGIDAIRSYEVYADPVCFNLRVEYDNYAYRTGTDKPIDDWCHLMDAIRYAVGTGMQVGGGSAYLIMGPKGKREFDLLHF